MMGILKRAITGFIRGLEAGRQFNAGAWDPASGNAFCAGTSHSDRQAERTRQLERDVRRYIEQGASW